jgi:ECF transporter S component (folate family)
MIKNRVLVEGAFLIALSIILTRFFSIKITVYGVEGVRIGLGVMPIIIAGFRLGLYQGAKVGALADIVGYLLSPGGAYMPHFTLTSALNGVLPSLLIGKKEKISEVWYFP